MNKPWVFIRVLIHMSPNILGDIRPGFLNQVPTLCRGFRMSAIINLPRLTQRPQYPLIKEYTLNHNNNNNAPII